MVSIHFKNIRQIGSFPPNRGENKQYLKPPPSKIVPPKDLQTVFCRTQPTEAEKNSTAGQDGRFILSSLQRHLPGVFSLNKKHTLWRKKKDHYFPPQVKKTNNSQQAPGKKRWKKEPLWFKNTCGLIFCAPKTPNLPETFHQASWIPTTARSVQHRRHHREVPIDTRWPPASRRPP